MTDPVFKVWRVVEEKKVADEQGHKYRTITKKEFIGEIVNPRQEIYVTWMELAERFGEGYYLVEIPKEVRINYVVPGEQRIKTPG
ncbi:MAG TPA: hypothetical protein VNE63_10245 [Candidatus Acidoferrales bacterium]|nr:hypothetical protein [Candidatus Acidoferrales bacterium]